MNHSLLENGPKKSMSKRPKFQYWCITIFLIAFALFVESFQCLGEVLWKDSFDSPETDGVWFAENGVWQEGIPSSGPGASVSAPNVVGTILDGSYPETANSRFIRFTTFKVPSSEQNPRLRFWHWFSFSSSDRGFVEVKPQGSDTWVQVSPNYVNTGSGVYSYASIDLRAFSEEMVQVAFHFIATDASIGADNSSGWYIDEVSLETGPLVFNNPEGFESGIGDWYAENGVWEVGEIANTKAGANGLATVIVGNYAEIADSRFISPPVKIPSMEQNPRLRFWHWFSFSSSDRGFVEVKPQGSDTWVQVSPDYVNTGSGVNSYASIDLRAFSDETVQIAFHVIATDASIGADNSSGWYIDEVSLETGPLVFSNPEGFESGIGDWYAENGVWEVGEVANTKGGTNGLATVIGGNYAEIADSRFISPPVEIASMEQNPRLRFWHWFSFSSSDRGFVEVKPQGSDTWVQVSPDYINTGSGVISYASIDMRAFSEETVQIAFHFIATDASIGADNSSGWYIDEVSLETGPLVFNNPEGFESGIGDWYAENGVWEVGIPTSGPGGSHSGQLSAGTHLGGNYAEIADSRLVSPFLLVPNCGTPFIRFFQWYNFSTSDNGVVEIQMQDSSEWQKVSSVFSGSSGGWSANIIDLTPFRGKVVRIAFRFIAIDASIGNDTSSGWYIDDIQMPEAFLIQIGSTLERTQTETSMDLTAYSSHGVVQIDFNLQIPDGFLGDISFDIDTEVFENITINKEGEDNWFLSLSSFENKPFHGFNVIGKVRFLGIVPHSSFVKLSPHDLVAIRQDGRQIECIQYLNGRAALIAQEPLLEAFLDLNGNREVILYGLPNIEYNLLYSTNYGSNGFSWQLTDALTIPEGLKIKVPVQESLLSFPNLFMIARE